MDLSLDGAAVKELVVTVPAYVSGRLLPDVNRRLAEIPAVRKETRRRLTFATLPLDSVGQSTPVAGVIMSRR